MAIKSSFTNRDCMSRVHLNGEYATVKFVADHMEYLQWILESIPKFQKYLGAYDRPPKRRDDGTPIQLGDYYLHTVKNTLYYATKISINEDDETVIEWLELDLTGIPEYVARCEAAAESAEASKEAVDMAEERVEAAKESTEESAATSLAAANRAVQAENSATESANSASASATTATDAKDVATTKASEASASADKAKASETAAKASETNAKASETAAKQSETNSATSAEQALASKNAAATSARQASDSAAKAEEWAVSETTKNSSKYWASQAKHFATATIIAGGTFTPAADNEYPALPTDYLATRPSGLSQDILFIIVFSNENDTYTYTTGDLTGTTVRNQDMLYYEKDKTTWVHVPSSRVTADMLNVYTKPEITMLLNMKVDSVNGHTGAVVLNSDDVDTYNKATIDSKVADAIKVESVNGHTGEVVLTAEDVDTYDKSELDTKFEEVTLAYPYAMSKAEFDALREKRKSDNSGSGFLEWGKHWYNTNSMPNVNEGMWTWVTNGTKNQIRLGQGYDAATATGISKTGYPIANIDGVLLNVDFVNANGSTNIIKLPPACDGTKTYDSATGQVIDYKTFSDERYPDELVALTHNEAVARAFEYGCFTNTDFRFAGDGWQGSTERGTTTFEQGEVTITDTTGLSPSTGSMNLASTSGVTWKTGQKVIVNIVRTDDTNSLAAIRLGTHGDPNQRFETLKKGMNEFEFEVGKDAREYCFLLYVGHNGTASFSNFSVRPATQNVITSRQDLVFLETWHEAVDEKSVLCPLGNVQYGASSWNGITLKKLTELGVGQGYSAFGEWDKETIGYGVRLSDLTDAQLQKFLSEPANNIYYDSEANKLIQVRYRVRVVEGLGDEWRCVRSTDELPRFGYGKKTLIHTQGQRDFETPMDFRWSKFYVGKNYADYGQGLTVFVGSKLNNTGVDVEAAYEGKCFALPIALVQRLNQGAYHPVYNPHGCAYISLLDPDTLQPNGNHSQWFGNDTPTYGLHPRLHGKWTTQKYSFIGQTSLSGYIGSSQGSGRPSNDIFKFHDAVCAGQVHDLRLSARKQETGKLLEDSIRKAVSGEMRGKGKIPFTIHDGIERTVVSVYIGETSSFCNLGSDFVPNKYFGDHNSKNRPYQYLYNKTKNTVIYVGYCEERNFYIHSISPASASADPSYINFAPAKRDLIATGDKVYCVNGYGLTPEFDELPWTDIIGSPENIAATFPNGVCGMWAGQITESSRITDIELTRKTTTFTGNTVVRVMPDGSMNVSTNNAFNSVDQVTNKPNGSYEAGQFADEVLLYQYSTLSKFTQSANNSAIVGSVGDVFATSHNGNNLGNRLHSSLTGGVGKGAGHYLFGNSAMTNTVFHADIMSVHLPQRHTELSSLGHGFENDSPAVKALSTITEKDGLLYLQLHGCELKHNGTSWGDDNSVPIVNGEGTKTDKNGNIVKTFCHHSVFPIGIADSSSSAIASRHDSKANISDGINSGLHFSTLDDVPDPIKEFYWQEEVILQERWIEEVSQDEEGNDIVNRIPNHVYGIHVHKHPSPFEDGGHISDENIAAWQFHDDFKQWLMTCAEIKFNECQEGVEAERVPLPPMPIREDY